jgi:hypothetical protein
MICPKCGIEYRDGFTKCSDCDTELVEKTGDSKEQVKIGPDGIKLIKFGVVLLFAAFIEMMAAVLVYEFNIVYLKTHGFMIDYNFTELLNPIIWYLFIIEIIVSIAVIIWGISYKEKNTGR